MYVDDILITGSDPKEISELLAKLNSVFTLKDLGEMNYFLGIEVMRPTSGEIDLAQIKYIK